MMINTEIDTTFQEFCCFELGSIVRQDSLGNAESVYDALKKFDCCLLSYIYRWGGLCPLGERINSDE
jgi:hypothetical protein